MTCDRCGNPTATTYGGLCGACVEKIVDGMHEALDQGDEGGGRP